MQTPGGKRAWVFSGAEQGRFKTLSTGPGWKWGEGGCAEP